MHKLKNYVNKSMVEIETKILKSVYQDKEGKFIFLDNEDFEQTQPFKQRIISKKTLQYETNDEFVNQKPIMSRLVNKQ